MNVERGTFEGEDHSTRDTRMEAVIEKARQDPRFAHLFEPIDEEKLLAQAEADIAAGRVYSNEEVIAWLKTWGTPDFKPFKHRWPG